jgi:hypothetical protein
MLIRIFAIACVAVLCTAPVLAQGPGLGVKAGVNLATERFAVEDGGPRLDWRTAGVGGVFLTLRLASWLELQPEALYAMKGARLDVDGAKSSVWLDYIEVPVLARVTRRGAGPLHYFVAAGPSVAFRVRARSRTEFGDVTEELDISDDLEHLDVGVAAGGGVERGRIVIEGRYTLGLTDVDSDKSDAVKVTSRTVSFTVGFRF